jgi:hypothetical protein
VAILDEMVCGVTFGAVSVEPRSMSDLHTTFQNSHTPPEVPSAESLPSSSTCIVSATSRSTSSLGISYTVITMKQSNAREDNKANKARSEQQND